jgi:hypothetical protein
MKSVFTLRIDLDATPAETGRDAFIEEIVARTGIDESMIDRLARTFYERARIDPLIGPVFAERVHDWEAHFRPHVRLLVIGRADERAVSWPADGSPSVAADRYAAVRPLARDFCRGGS